MISFVHHVCVVEKKNKKLPTRDELADLRLKGAEADVLTVTCYNIAYIMGDHFRAGGWGRTRCGCVFTMVTGGRSVYGRIERFWKVTGDDVPGYASVTWFGLPVYPFGTPLVVRVTLDGTVLTRELGIIIPITQIDPSQVMVEPVPGQDACYVMRDSGYDTMP